MIRAARLLHLLDQLRRARSAQSGKTLAEQLGVSLRTIYRDIATLRAQGAAIAGDPGTGYEMRPGFMLPPMMFSSDELEALQLGCHWASRQADTALAQAATAAWERIRCVLPLSLRIEADTTGLVVPPSPESIAEEPWQGLLRVAVRRQNKVALSYTDEKGQCTERTVWPFAIGFFEGRRIVVAWCEMRQDFRHFRADRVQCVVDLAQRYPDQRTQLLARWADEKGYRLR